MQLSVSRYKAQKPLPTDVINQVLKRDDHSCHYCQFRAEKYQLIHHLDGNPNNQTLANMVTTCMFCHQCFHLEDVAPMGSGVLIWMPEISQPDLNNLARSIYIARISQGVMSETAKSMLEVIMERRNDARNRLGTDDPFVLATVLTDFLTKQAYERRNEKLDGVRLFPLDRRKIRESGLEFNQFPQILAYWRSKQGPFAGHPPLEWLPRYKDMLLPEAA
ncbi:MAG: HNH endonuclease [Rhodospirillales bacterium]|nr:HNH endonuclease [Rhodospirillales bacterium]MCB9965642.1 HNH endonuclease [Rhodospirillales bacterium]